MSPRRLRNLAASVRQRLLNLARERSEDFNHLLTRYANERLLFRLAESAHRDQFVLKGCDPVRAMARSPASRYARHEPQVLRFCVSLILLICSSTGRHSKDRKV